MVARKTFTAPNWGDSFVNKDGVPVRRSQAWIDEVSRIVNNEIADLSDVEDRLDELEPNFVVVTNAESPYAAANNDYILADMSSGDVTITLPSSGRLSVARDGVLNTLTLTGMVNGDVNPEILFDGSTASMAFITEWRYV